MTDKAAEGVGEAAVAAEESSDTTAAVSADARGAPRGLRPTSVKTIERLGCQSNIVLISSSLSN